MVVKRRRRGCTELLFITFQAFSAAAVVKPPPPPTFALYKKNTKQENKKTFPSLLSQCQLLCSLSSSAVQVFNLMKRWTDTSPKLLSLTCSHLSGLSFSFQEEKIRVTKSWVLCNDWQREKKKKTADFKASEWVKLKMTNILFALFSSLISSMANNFHLSGGIANWDLASSCCCCESNSNSFTRLNSTRTMVIRDSGRLWCSFSLFLFSAKGSKKGNGQNGKIIKQTVVQVLQKETS